MNFKLQEIYQILLLSIEEADTNKIDTIYQMVPDEFEQLIENEEYLAIIHAARNGHAHILDTIFQLLPQKTLDAISAREFASFSDACEAGHQDVLEVLIKFAPAYKAEMIKARQYDAYKKAIDNKQWHIVDFLHDAAKEANELHAMLTVDNNHYPKNSAQKGKLHLLKSQFEADPEFIPNIIEAENFEIFRIADTNERSAIAKFLLNQKVPSLIAYIDSENNPKWNNYYLHSFIVQIINSLETKVSQNKLELSASDNLLVYYVIRNLLRRQDKSLLADIGFLVSIPSVAETIINQLNSPTENNEVLSLINDSGVKLALILLTMLPEIEKIFNISPQTTSRENHSTLQSYCDMLNEYSVLSSVEEKMKLNTWQNHLGEFEIQDAMLGFLILFNLVIRQTQSDDQSIGQFIEILIKIPAIEKTTRLMIDQENCTTNVPDFTYFKTTVQEVLKQIPKLPDLISHTLWNSTPIKPLENPVNENAVAAASSQ